MRLFACGLLAVLIPHLAAAAPPAVLQDPTYQALREMRPDGRRVAVSGAVLERDAFRFRFDEGAFHFLASVEGRTLGAVFVGRGTFTLNPATEAERRRLAFAAGGDPRTYEVLSEPFRELVFFWTDASAAELEAFGATTTGEPDRAALSAFEAHMKRQKKEYHTDFHLRLLTELLETTGIDEARSSFMAFFPGGQVPTAIAAVDRRGAEALRLGSGLGGEDVVFFVQDNTKGGLWYLTERQDEARAGKFSPFPHAADALHYAIDTEVDRDEKIRATTTIVFEVEQDGLRVLPILLLPDLRIEEAKFWLESAENQEAAKTEQVWTDLAVVQEGVDDDNDAAVIFPTALVRGQRIQLRLRYAGDRVLEDRGENNFAVGARLAWYPNLGVFADPATFEMTFRVPAGNEVVAIGERVSQSNANGSAISTWRVETPVQVAGFNYGKFERLERRDDISGVNVEVYTNPGTPTVIRELNAMMNGERLGREMYESSLDQGPSLGKVDTGRLAEAALADGLNSAKVFTTWFGKLPFRRVAITQQSQWTFGQSWPSLIFMPYVSFLDGTQRARLGLGLGAKQFVDVVGHHEFAHQWWGHLLGWHSYRDQWLSEGFAEFSAALALQYTVGWRAYDAFWKNARARVVTRTPGNFFAPWEAGAVTDGFRSGTPRTPSASFALIYEKGGYVVHMLRMLMRDPSAEDPDARFIAMMKDFTATHAGKNPSTEDFQRIVERHWPKDLDLTADGKADWFFRQWVHGWELPRYSSKLTIQNAGADGFRIQGKADQLDVPPSFRMRVPIDVEIEKDIWQTAGWVTFVGAQSVDVDLNLLLEKKPRRALINGRGIVLARD